MKSAKFTALHASSHSPRTSDLPQQQGLLSKTAIIALGFGPLVLAAHLAGSQQAPIHSARAAQTMQDMAGMKMDHDNMDRMNMKDMGPSMAAMAEHMRVTTLRAAQPGDEEKARAVLEEVKASIERYQDYHQALAEGFDIANEKLEQPQYHFNSAANIKAAAEKAAQGHFDPTRPSSLLYYKDKKKKYRLEGVMFTIPPTASEDELNERLPLSIVRWHEHVKFCAAPANKVQEYLGQHPKFGMFGSITTEDACKAEGGTFYPVIFTWMVHVFPYETDLQEAFSMNDDVPHFGTTGSRGGSGR